MSGPHLTVNLESLGGGALRVELRRADLSQIPGYEAENCVPITEDGYRIPVRWRNKNDTGDVVRQSVMIVFRFTRCVLYAYRIG